MKFESTSNLLSASFLLICCAGRKFTSQNIKRISSLTISFLVLFANVNSVETFAQQGRHYQRVNENKITKSELHKTSNANGEVEQEWVAIYNGVGGLRSEEASDISVDSFGNVYVTGYSQSLGYDFDCATIKYDAHGEVQWISRYDGGYYDWPYKLAIDNSGNVYITGYSVSDNTGDDYLTIKYNTDGVEQWVRKYNGPGNSIDRSNYIAIDDSGNVYVTGESYGLGTYSDFATIKYNSLGMEQWVNRYNGPDSSYDEAVAITIDNSGNILVAGKSIGIFPNYNYATIKYNIDGIEQWIKRYASGGNFDDVPYDIAVDDSGNIYVTGYASNPDTTIYDVDYLTIKYNSSGNQQWTARYNGTGNNSDAARAIGVDDTGNVYVTGWSVGEGGRHDHATIKYNSSGIEQWVSRFNGGFVYDLVVDRAGNVYTTGNYSDSTTIGDFITIKYNSYGEAQWIVGYNGPGDGLDGAVAITLDQFDNIYVTGFVEVQGGIPSFDFATVKYKQRIVPVELTNFNATVNSGTVNLSWQTATEINNQGFEIQRQVGSKQSAVDNWDIIGFVPGFGTITEPKSYTYEDKDVSHGVYYYRLKQVDFDGSFEFSGIVEITFGVQQEFLLEQNFPNPFNSATTINYSIAEPSQVVLKVYTTLGEEVAVLVNEKKDLGKYSLSFNAEALPSGVYLYKLNTSGTYGEYYFVKKFILLK